MNASRAPPASASASASRHERAAEAAVAALGQRVHELDLGGARRRPRTPRTPRGRRRRRRSPRASRGACRRPPRRRRTRPDRRRSPPPPSTPRAATASPRSPPRAAPRRPAPGAPARQLAPQVGQPLRPPADRHELVPQPLAAREVLELDPPVGEPGQRGVRDRGQLGGPQPGIGALDPHEVVVVVQGQVGRPYQRPVLPRLDAIADERVETVPPGDRVLLGAHALPFTNRCWTVSGSKPSRSYSARARPSASVGTNTASWRSARDGVEHRGDHAGREAAAAGLRRRVDVLEHPVAAAVEQQRVRERAALLEGGERASRRSRRTAGGRPRAPAGSARRSSPRASADPLVAQPADVAVGHLLREHGGLGRRNGAVPAEQHQAVELPPARPGAPPPAARRATRRAPRPIGPGACRGARRRAPLPRRRRGRGRAPRRCSGAVRTAATAW